MDWPSHILEPSTIKAIMKTTKSLLIATALLTAGSIPASGQSSELDQLKQTIQGMEKTIEQMKQKIADLEKQKTPAAEVIATNKLEASSASIRRPGKSGSG